MSGERRQVDIRTRSAQRLATVITEVRLDWSALGEHFAAASSEQQAEFFLGFEAEFEAMGYLDEDRQYAYIAEGIPAEHIRNSIADRLTRLAEALGVVR